MVIGNHDPLVSKMAGIPTEESLWEARGRIGNCTIGVLLAVASGDGTKISVGVSMITGVSRIASVAGSEGVTLGKSVGVSTTIVGVTSIVAVLSTSVGVMRGSGVSCA
jgi:hypothetical protein